MVEELTVYRCEDCGDIHETKEAARACEEGRIILNTRFNAMSNDRAGFGARGLGQGYSR